MSDPINDNHLEAGANLSNDMVLSFRLNGERFALTVGHVNEILDPIEETVVPNAPSLSPALINVRGSVVPLVHIRGRLGMTTPEKSETARFVVLDLPIADEMTRLAIEVDAVDEVIEADRTSLERIPELGARWPAEFIEGVARSGGDLVVILKPETLFDPSYDLRPSARRA